EQIGPSKAAFVLLTGRRFKGEEAVVLGMADLLVPADKLLEESLKLAREIAANAPLSIEATYRTLRAGLGDRVRAATKHEAEEQARLSATRDAREGIKAVSERRDGNFIGK
ncbi:MAG: enoyl-CoA hydratase/isomerase family protein, partial [Acidimicrobiia bacterium]